MHRPIACLYAVAAFVVAALFVYVWLFANPVPFAPFTLVALSVAAIIASGASRRVLMPEHKAVPGLLNPIDVRLYLPRVAYVGFCLSLVLLFTLLMAGMVALGNPSRQPASSWLLLLSGWWFFEFYFAAAMLLLGRAPSNSHESAHLPSA